MLCFVSYQHPCVDGSGICNSDGPTVNRLPISTPRRHRTRIVAKASDADAAAKDTTNTYHRGLPVDVTIPAQVTNLGPEKTSFFQALQIPTKITRGTIEIIVRR